MRIPKLLSQAATLNALRPGYGARIVPPRVWSDPERHLEAGITHPWYKIVTQLNGCVFHETFRFFSARGFLPAPLPVTAQAVSSPMGLGSDSLPVEIELFGEKTFLADSMQFQLEYLLRQGLKGVYYIMPTFRGEEHDETHLNQFLHSEAEMLGGLEDVISLIESYVSGLASSLLSEVGEVLESAGSSLAEIERVAKSDEFPRVLYRDARRELGDSGFRLHESGEWTITRAGERELIRRAGGPVWLVNPPSRVVPFYQASNASGEALSADLLIGIGEVVGCGERCLTEHDVRRSLVSHAVPHEPYEWYARMKGIQQMRTAGFGLGVERFLMWALGNTDIRDLSLLPRLKGVRSWI